MADAQAPHKHPYHMVDPSPWPVLGASAGGLLAIGAVLYMHEITAFVLPVGLLAVLAVMAFWWREVIWESVKQKAHTPIAKIGLRYGVALFIASEVMFFVAFFWAFFDSSLFPKAVTAGLWDPFGSIWLPDEAAGGVAIGIWPPEGVKPFDPFELPLLNTLILLLSATSCTWAHHAILENKRDQYLTGLAVTIALGLIFTGLQAYEYSHAAFGFRDGIFASTFYMATGFHGFHVIVGTIFLCVCWWRGYRGHFDAKSHFGFEAAAWYWHFVDVVWLFLFFAIYWWGG